MTLDEAIKHCEEVAEEQDKLCKRYDDASGYSRSHNEDIRTTGAIGCEVCAKEHRQLAEWLKDYKRLLEQEPCEDCISRQAVKDMLMCEWTRYIPMDLDVNLSFVLAKVDELPLVKPQYTEAEIQKMQELEQAEIQKAYELGKAEQPCEDCISRQAVLEQINCWIGSGEYRYTNATDYLTRRMQGIPLATPKPKTVLYSGDGYADGYMVYDMAECPNCGYEYEDGDKDWGLSFCPNCGQALDWESEDKK